MSSTSHLSSHVMNCINAFECVAAATQGSLQGQSPLLGSNDGASALRQALTVIYHENSSMLKSLLNEGHFSSGVSDLQNSSMGMIKELLCITSTLLMSVSSPRRSQALSTASSVLVALSPYWAVVVFVTQIGGSHGVAEKTKLLSSLKTLFNDSSVLESAKLLAADASSISNGFARSALSSVLHFAVQFILAMRQSLERKILIDKLPMKFVSSILDMSDRNSLQLLQFLLRSIPRLALTGDFSRAQTLPLSYVVSCIGLLSSATNHLSAEKSSQLLFDRLYVHAALLFCQLTPQCVGYPDRQRRVALHYACMNVNMPSILPIILHALPCTAALADVNGLYPVNYLLRNGGRDEKLALEILQVYPNAVSRQAFSSYLEDTQEKQSTPMSITDTDNESLSESSHVSVCAIPPLVDCDSSDAEDDCMLRQYAASLLMLKSAPSSPSDSNIFSVKMREKSSLQGSDSPAGKRVKRGL